MKNDAIEYLESYLTDYKNQYVNFTIETEDCLINVHGKFRKQNERYLFTKGKRKIAIEKKKIGSIWTWKGTRDEYWLEFTESGKIIFEFRVPQDVNIQIEDE